MVTEKPLAIIGAPEGFEAPANSGAVVTSLSADTAVRNGFDVLLLEVPKSRREAVDLVRLAEEAEARVGLPRWLRRALPSGRHHTLMNVVGGANCRLSDLVDLALWMSGSPGVQRMEVQVAGPVRGISLRGHGGELMSIQTSELQEEVRIWASGGPDEPLLTSIEWEPDRGIADEIIRFAEGDDQSVLLEDSVDLVAVLERVHRRVR
ncbi:MAG: hypothetical protein JJ976_03735 [Rhodothermales bacterium]|nr:hypothetical protein [Rhodothermales bacterium]